MLIVPVGRFAPPPWLPPAAAGAVASGVAPPVPSAEACDGAAGSAAPRASGGRSGTDGGTSQAHHSGSGGASRDAMGDASAGRTSTDGGGAGGRASNGNAGATNASGGGESGTTGGTSTSGTNTGGTNSGGADTGGADAGGTNTGGINSGGVDTGGADAGGTDTGGTDTGGADTGGADTGGAGVGGLNAGGTSASTGGANAGGVGGTPASCDIGCEPQRDCGEQQSVWECDASFDHAFMLDSGCEDLMTGVPRYCCPTSFMADCLPRLVVDHAAYQAGATIDPRWENPTDESIFLPGCTTVLIERDNGSGWDSLGPPAICAWEGIAVEVASGSTYTEPLVTLTEAGTYRFTGSYSFGCTAGEPLSEAACQRGPVPLASGVFVIE